MLDVARRIAGTGSLGVERYAILVRGKGSLDGNYLLDLKLVCPSSLSPYIEIEQPKWKTEAPRVGRGAAANAGRLRGVSLAGRHRSHALSAARLQPSEDRITLDGASQSLAEIGHVIATMGRTVTWGQLRSSRRDGSATVDELIAFARRGKWPDKLLATSHEMARLTLKDAATFAAAFDRALSGRKEFPRFLGVGNFQLIDPTGMQMVEPVNDSSRSASTCDFRPDDLHPH